MCGGSSRQRRGEFSCCGWLSFEIELLQVAVEVGDFVVCWVDITWVSFLNVRKGICERGFARLVVDACERVENVGEFGGLQIGDGPVSTVDGPAVVSSASSYYRRDVQPT